MRWPPELEVLPTVSRRMAAIRGRDNKPERSLRSALHRYGLRFRLHRVLLPGTRRTTDIVLPKYRIAIFVDGCFWHGCPLHAGYPRTNESIWTAKLARNVERDRDTTACLEGVGWTVVRVWEHENMAIAAERIYFIARGHQPS